MLFKGFYHFWFVFFNFVSCGYIKTSTNYLYCDVSCKTLPICKHSIKPVLAIIPKQLIPSCTPLVDKQFALGLYSDLMTG